MDFKITRLSNCTVKITSSKPLRDEEIIQFFGEYGKINDIVTDDNQKIIHYGSEEAAQRCIDDTDKILSVLGEINFDLDSTGDTVSKNDDNVNFGKIKRLYKQLTQIKPSHSENDSKGTTSNTSTSRSDAFTPACSSPVLLNTADPGFRLAYCHNVTNFKPDLKVKKLNRFNQSIKKYMDSTLPLGIQELVLTNLPANVQKEDVYKLCGQIEPASVELKTTANINVLYAYIQVKTKDDFNKLSEILSNCYINGVKINSIPITKIINPVNQASKSSSSSSEIQQLGSE